eukprot:Hpha_TRINITY_DN16281_c4_g10::TRINITY_DN16281_c4_g10_i2::g.14928::m.14928
MRCLLMILYAVHIVLSSTPFPSTPPVPFCAVEEVFLGSTSSCVKYYEGFIKCFGTGSRGRLGTESTNNVGDAAGEMGLALPQIDIAFSDGSTRIGLWAVGKTFVCSVGADINEIKCFGKGGVGQLGDGSTTDRGGWSGSMGSSLPAVGLPSGCTVIQIESGESHTCVLCSDRTLMYCWGGNVNGRLGVGDTTNRGDVAGWEAAWAPTDVGGTISVMFSMGSSSTHQCVIMDTGGVKCWGGGTDGQLGTGLSVDIGDNSGEMGASLASITIPSNLEVRDGCVGLRYTCFMYTNNQAECWGLADFGQTGRDATTTTTAPDAGFLNLSGGLGGEVLDRVYCGISHNCAVSNAGSKVVCWGDGTSGQLGTGDLTSRGGVSGDMAALTPIQVGQPNDIVYGVSMGISHTCVNMQSGVYCWGGGAAGRIGSGATQAITSTSGLAAVDLSCPSSAPTLAPTSPTVSPSIPPTTSSPSVSPTTSFPTDSPSTSFPTADPTTSFPTDSPSTSFPTADPTTSFPTDSPSTS